jgi:hypothetical protein
LVRLAGIEPARLKHGVLSPRVSAYSTTGVWCGSSDLHREATGFKPVRSAHSLQIRKWCQAPDSHREAVRFELTRYANSHQLGGTHGRTRTDTSRFRKSASAPSAWVWRPELDSNQHRRLRRPSTGPSAGANWSGRRESNPVAASLATISRTMRARVAGSCRRICTCYLRLIRSVLICMSFAAGVGQDGRTCTCGFRVPSSAVCY